MSLTLPIRKLPPWRPDAADLLSGYATVASGLIPAPVGYRPAKNFHTNTAEMSALTARCQGAAAFVSPLDQLTYIVAGDATRLYQNLGGTATNVSKSGGYTVGADEQWEFASVDGRFIAAHIGDAIQAATMNASPLVFADLVTSTLKPRARHIATVGRQLMIGNTSESGVAYPNRVRWCAIDANGNADPTDFDESQTTLADRQDVEDELGSVQRIVGGARSGLVLCTHGAARFDFVGTPDIYVPVKLSTGDEGSDGCLAPGSSASGFYLARRGFVHCDGQSIKGIGSEKIDTWFFDTWYGPSLAHRISACIDTVRKLYIVAFPSTASTGNPDRLLFFHMPTGEWSYAALTCQLIANLKTRGVTLEELDTHPLGGTNIDAMTISLDSPIWSGGEAQIIGFNTLNEGRAFTGANLAVTFEDGVQEFIAGKRVMVDNIRPLSDGGTLSAAVAMRERLNDSETFGSAVTQNAAGLCPFETGNVGRYAKPRLSIAAGGTYNHLEGYQPTVQEMGDL